MKIFLVLIALILNGCTSSNDVIKKSNSLSQSKSQPSDLNISKYELTKIGEKIFYNEANSKKEKLVWWNYGEAFPSLGIGHFIWYPEGYNGPFDESLPKLREYYIQKGIKLPKILSNNKYSPWKNRNEMESKRDTAEFKELTDFFYNTKDTQIAYIYSVRLTSALDIMLTKTKNKKHVEAQFKRVVMSNGGLYPLIDYINFKGEGVLESERYNGQGWGLLQVLEEMDGTEVGQSALDEFSRASAFVLSNRVKNSPPGRGESRWLPGWTTRCESYKKP